jgi:hypothetical protein
MRRKTFSYNIVTTLLAVAAQGNLCVAPMQKLVFKGMSPPAVR